MATAQSFTSSAAMPAMKKDGPENCEKWVSCCLKAIKYTSAKCHLSLSRSRARAINCRTFVGVEKYIYFPAPPKNSNLLSSHFPKKNRPPQIPFLVIQPKNICHKRREDLNYQTFKITASVFLLKPKYIIILFLKVEIFILCT